MPIVNSDSHKIRRITIDPVNWTPVYPEMDCNKVVISRETTDETYAVRSNPDDPQTELLIAAGWKYPIEANTGTFTTAFQKARVAIWVRATSTAGPLVVESTR